MIHFACEHCGKQFDQPDEAAGTLFVCECGQSIHIPVGNLSAEVMGELAERPLAASAPQRCFNHSETQAEQPCDACGELFCALCLVTLRGRVLCSPCKNFSLRVRQQPPKVAGLAIASVIVSLGMGLCGHFLILMGATNRQPGLAFFSVVPQLLALGLGLWAVRQVETKPRTTGMALAMTGLLVAFVVSVELILFAFLMKQYM